MTASDRLGVLESSALVAPITALEFLGDDYLLTGDGPILSVFSLHASLEQCASITVLHNYRIHGIRPKVQNNEGDTTISEIVKLLSFGGKAVRLIHFKPSGLELEVAGPLLELQDWVLDVSWMSTDSYPLLGICLAHNAVLLLEPESGKLSLRCCVEACLLYSALLIGPIWENSVLVGGTVFNQLVLWRPKGTGTDDRSQVERRLLGHSGVIFSLCYLKSSGWLASASDDRSVRVWHVGSLGTGETCGEESPTCLRVLYGHQARVFCVRLLPGCVVSAGEDGACLIWQLAQEGKVGQTLKGHRSGGIRALAVSEKGGWVATGGADGGIRLWRASDVGGQEKDKQDSEKQIDLGFSGQGCPKVVRTVGEHQDVLVSTDQGEVFLYQDGLWKLIWKGGSKFQTYCVMEVACIQSQNSCFDEWVCAVGNLNGEIQVFAIHRPSSGIFLQAGEGKVQSLQWVEGCNGLTLLASSLNGLVYRWEVKVQKDEGESGQVLHLEKQKSFQLPQCSKRWLTAAVTLPCEKGSLWLCGDRRGSLLLYKEVVKCGEGEDGEKNNEAWENENRWPETNDTANALCPISTLFGVHGRQGVTSVSKHHGVCYSTGRDGCVRVLMVTGHSLNVRRVYRASKGMEWLEKVLFLGSAVSENRKSRIEDSKEDDNSVTEEEPQNELAGSEEIKEKGETADESISEIHFVMAGFHSVQFVLWDPLRREKLLSVPCGGGHRSWAYISTMETLQSTYTIGHGTLIFIKQGSVMASRCQTSSATKLTGHTLKEGLQGRGQSCVCHLGSISKGGASSEKWEVLVTGGEDTTVTVLAVEPKHGIVKVLNVISDHISNVRTVAAMRIETKQEGTSNRNTKTLSSFSTFLFSAGGRAQLQCYRLLIGWDNQMNRPVCQVVQVSGHRLDEQWERRRNRHKTVKMDPETRYMSIAVVNDSRMEILLALACSDGAVRLFTLQEGSRKMELLWESFYHQRCVLTVASCKSEDPQGNWHVLLFSGATDGAVALWDLTVLESKSRDSWHGPSAPCFTTPVHQSGVNTIVILKCPESGQIHKDVLTVASGGDDGQLSLIKIRVKFRQGVVFPELLCHYSVQLAHAAPLTALSNLNPDLLFSTSPDQRVRLWRVCEDGLQHQATVFSHTADAAGLGVWHREGSGGEAYVVVCGQGLQMFKLTERGQYQGKELEKPKKGQEERQRVIFSDCFGRL